MTISKAGLKVLAVDDEVPSLADLVYELHSIAAVGSVVEARDATEALRALRSETFDVVFLDVRMPGLDGVELARILSQFRVPPPIVFVTAFEAHAVDAFEINAVDYLLKPVRRDRLEVAVNKVRARMVAANEQVAPLESGALSDRPVAEFTAVTIDAVPPIVESSDGQSAAPVAAKHPFDEDLISIESGGRIRVVDRRDVLFAESSGDYVRLHLASTSVLVRASMSTLEEHWATAGFVRIHRSYLVSLSHVSDVLVEHGHGYRVTVGDRSLPVSRRLAGQLRTHLVEYAARRARP